jgi:uncharacterized membrane protein YdcZ (DUF606 family)
MLLLLLLLTCFGKKSKKEQFDTGGKPSTWFALGGFVEQMFVTRIHVISSLHIAAQTHGRACKVTQERN